MPLLDLAPYRTSADRRRVYGYLPSFCRGRGGWVDLELHNPLSHLEEMLKKQALSPGDPLILLGGSLHITERP